MELATKFCWRGLDGGRDGEGADLRSAARRRRSCARPPVTEGVARRHGSEGRRPGGGFRVAGIAAAKVPDLLPLAHRLVYMARRWRCRWRLTDNHPHPGRTADRTGWDGGVDGGVGGGAGGGGYGQGRGSLSRQSPTCSYYHDPGGQLRYVGASRFDPTIQSTQRVRALLLEDYLPVVSLAPPPRHRSRPRFFDAPGRALANDA